MRNVTKLLCVILALVIALSVTSCSLTKQYSYQDDDIELPVGVYIYYLYEAYTSAQSKAQQTDAYDQTTGKYNGKKSFLKVEITDDDGETVIAEDWIKDTALEKFQNAVAINYEYNAVGATIDEKGPDDMYSSINIYAIYNSQTGQLDESLDRKLSEVAEEYEKYGIGFDSWLLCNYSFDQMKEAAFQKEYAEDGPSAVSTDEITKYFNENYSAYSTISANLYTSSGETDENGNTTNVALSADEIKKYEDAFKAYVQEINAGKSIDDVAAEYKQAFGIDDSDESAASIPDSQEKKIEKDSEDELDKVILGLKEGQATYKIIGEEETSRVIYLIYKAPIKSKTSDYIDDESKRSNLLHEMKDDAFSDLLDELVETNDIKPSSACNGYQPSYFEKKK